MTDSVLQGADIATACRIAEDLSAYNTHPGVLEGHNEADAVTGVLFWAVGMCKQNGVSLLEAQGALGWAFHNLDTGKAPRSS